MAEKEQEKPTVLLNLRDRVKIRHSGGFRGRIVELPGLSGQVVFRCTESGFGASRSPNTLS